MAAIQRPLGRKIVQTAQEKTEAIGRLRSSIAQKVSRVSPKHKADKDEQPGAKHNYMELENVFE